MLAHSYRLCTVRPPRRVCSSVGQSTVLIRRGSLVRDQPDPPSSRQAAWVWRADAVCDARGISSAGRAPALQAGGRRFEPVILHHGCCAGGGCAVVVREGHHSPAWCALPGWRSSNLRCAVMTFGLLGGLGHGKRLFFNNAWSRSQGWRKRCLPWGGGWLRQFLAQSEELTSHVCNRARGASVRRRRRAAAACAVVRSDLGCSFGGARGWVVRPVGRVVRATRSRQDHPDYGGNAIGSSEQEHAVDALAMTGDEGRGSLRKASGSWQASIDPGMSEWGNPPDEGIGT